MGHHNLEHKHARGHTLDEEPKPKPRNLRLVVDNRIMLPPPINWDGQKPTILEFDSALDELARFLENSEHVLPYLEGMASWHRSKHERLNPLMREVADPDAIQSLELRLVGLELRDLVECMYISGALLRRHE